MSSLWPMRVVLHLITCELADASGKSGGEVQGKGWAGMGCGQGTRVGMGCISAP